jgi:hypothetical protein
MHQIFFYLNQRPILYVVIYTLILCFSTFVLKKTKYIFPILIVLALIYFGPLAVLKTILLFLSSFVIGKKIFKNDNLISLILGLLTITQSHILISLVTGVQTSQNILYIFEFFIVVFSLRQINIKLFNDLKESIASLNIIELFLVYFSFTISSQPQTYWDAVHANLYNAKWYFQSNSLSPIIESISSLFPQNGIMFFSYFYGMGGNKMLQIAYILPLVLTIFIFKKIKTHVKNKSFFTLASLLLIATPIFIFESSNGYYDSLITVCCLTVIYILLKDRIETKEILSCSFVIGFAAAVKYFPIVLSLIPIIYIFLSNKNYINKFKILFVSFLIIIFPLTIWGTRAYLTTKNPFYPFAQYIFPTPALWSPTNILENNFMIQTSMSAKKWLLGGFSYYPIETYVNSDQFLEAAKGYTTRAPIILNTISLIFIIYFIYRLFRHKKISNSELLLLMSYISLIIIGLTSRYYRYLWPYQTTTFILTIYCLSQKFNKNIFINLLLITLLISNLNHTYDHLKTYPIYSNRLFNPNYFQNNQEINDPILFLNKNTNTNDNVLDASKYILHRVNINSRVTQCDWYWIMGQDKIKEEGILSNFKFIIISTDKTYKDYCFETITKSQNKYIEVFKNQDYIILKAL